MRHISTSAKNKDLESTKKNMFSADSSQLIPAEKVGPGWSWDAEPTFKDDCFWDVSLASFNLEKTQISGATTFRVKSDGNQSPSPEEKKLKLWFSENQTSKWLVNGL